MKEEPVKAARDVRTASRRPAAVDGIARDGMPDRVEVDPDLVRPTGHEVELEERPAGESLAHPVTGCRLATVGDHGHLRPVLRIATNRGFDAAEGGRHLPVDEGEVRLLHPPRLELGHERVLRGIVLRHHQQPARVAIETMDDAGALDARDPAEVKAAEEQH